MGSNKTMRKMLLPVVVCLLALSVSAQDVDHTTGKFHRCPPEGKRKSAKGFYDPTLNELKNRDIAPTRTETRTLTEILANKPKSVVNAGKHARSVWSDKATEAVADWEATGATVEGRLIAIRNQGPESCNCYSSDFVDIHLWIATKASASAKPTRSVVIEISPRNSNLQALHDQLVQLAKKGTRIRVTGWMMWDEEHGSEVGKSRGTLWEIHPVHKIEVFQNGKWTDIQK
jgi:hypothetical protein